MKRCVAVLLLSVITAGVLFGCSSVPKEELYPVEIKMGMTVDEVRAIMGGEGEYEENATLDQSELYYEYGLRLNEMTGGISYWFDKKNRKLVEISIFAYNAQDGEYITNEELKNESEDYLTRKFGKPDVEKTGYAVWGVKDRDVMFTLSFSDARIIVERYNPYFCNEEPE